MSEVDVARDVSEAGGWADMVVVGFRGRVSRERSVTGERSRANGCRANGAARIESLEAQLGRSQIWPLIRPPRHH